MLKNPNKSLKNESVLQLFDYIFFIFLSGFNTSVKKDMNKVYH